ncbi:MAG: hypothetical protein JSU01_11305 [Bacteroidetes bacterium]|nr:hypothetical protein [Bacteroidota bacterium]
MKKIVWIILAISGFAACKKDKIAPDANVIGKWELHRRYGGNIYPPDTTYQAGNGNILQFNSDSTYKTYSGGMLTDEGTFHILRHAYKMGDTWYDELSFNSTTDYALTYNITFPDVVSISGTILTLRPTMPDIGTTEYEKLSD